MQSRLSRWAMGRRYHCVDAPRTDGPDTYARPACVIGPRAYEGGNRPSGALLADLLREAALPLNVVRLALAFLVLISHTFPLGGLGVDPPWPTLQPATSLGGFAVGGFFALSGMLVAMSAKRNSIARFIWARLLRIFPAYLAVLVISAAVLAPAIYWDTHRTLLNFVGLDAGGPFRYVAKNIFFPTGMQFGIRDVFLQTTPYGRLVGASAVNGSLWTLPIEVRCYLVALGVAIAGRRLGAARTAVGALAIVGAFIVSRHLAPNVAASLAPKWLPDYVLELGFVFLCGVVAGSVADRLRMTRTIALGVIVVFLACSAFGGLAFRTVGLGSLALLLPLLAARVPRDRLRWFRNDLSYGTYIWAFPIQQSLSHLGLNAFPGVYFLVAAASTLAMAALSWKLIEQPALRLKGWRPTANRPPTVLNDVLPPTA